MKQNASTKNLFVIFALSLSAILASAQTSDKDALNKLKEGNKRFLAGQMLHENQNLATVKELSTGQHPFAVIVSCSDSRVTGDIVFDQGLGDLFTIRTAGNVMSDYEEGSIEYAAEHLNTKLIVVMGHTGCGAVKAFLDVVEGNREKVKESSKHLGHIQSIIKELKNEKEIKEVLESKDNHYPKAIIANVAHGVKQLRTSKPTLSELHKEGKINIVGAVYHIETGEVEFLDL